MLLLTCGAVNNPLLEILPALADQVTAVLDVPLTRAVNCNWASEPTVALSGVNERLMEGLGELVAVFDEVVLHATAKTIRKNNNVSEQ